jgi:hypothetical protein
MFSRWSNHITGIHYPLISRWSFLCELSDLNRVWLSCKYEQPFVMHDSFWDWMAIHLNRLFVQLLRPHDYSSVVGDSNRKVVIYAMLHDNWLAFCVAQLAIPCINPPQIKRNEVDSISIRTLFACSLVATLADRGYCRHCASRTLTLAPAASHRRQGDTVSSSTNHIDIR